MTDGLYLRGMEVIILSMIGAQRDGVLIMSPLYVHALTPYMNVIDLLLLKGCICRATNVDGLDTYTATDIGKAAYQQWLGDERRIRMELLSADKPGP